MKFLWNSLWVLLAELQALGKHRAAPKGILMLAHNQCTYAKEEAELQHKGILQQEDMFSAQQNIFVMNVTYVVLFLCLAGDKKNRSNAKMKTKWSI